MTREEVLTRLLHIGNDIRDFCDGAKHMGDEDKKDIEALNYAIAKIKEESKTLDKIRTEIMQLDNDIEAVDYDYNDMAQIEVVHIICREEVLRIINKYKTESEGNE